MDLTERLDVLKNSGTLSRKNYDNVMRVIRYFKERRGIELTEENASTSAWHWSGPTKGKRRSRWTGRSMRKRGGNPLLRKRKAAAGISVKFCLRSQKQRQNISAHISA